MVDVDAVVADLAVGDVIKPVNEVGDRSFACAGRADEGELLTGLGVKGHVMKHRLIRHVAKVYVKEANVALEQTVFHRAVILPVLPGPFARALRAGDDCAVFLAAARKRDGSFVTLGLLIEKLKDTSRARNGHRNGVHLLGDLRDVCRKLFAHAEVRRDNGDRKGRNERSVQDKVLNGEIRNRAAERHEKAACERGEHVQKVTDVVHDRHEDICKAVCLACVGEELVVELVKIGLRGLLMAEDLDDFLAVHHFLDEALGLAERVLLADEVFGGFTADVLGRKRHADDAENDDHHQRHAVIEHHAHNADDGKSRGDEVRKALGNDLPQRIGVVCEAGHDVAARRAVKVGDRKALHGREHTLAGLVQKALRDVRHELGVDGCEDDVHDIKRGHGDKGA